MTMTSLVKASDFDLNERFYAALNCRAGIVVSILRDFEKLDVRPAFAEINVDFARLVAPMMAGDIAGAHMGVISDAVWQSRFGVEFARSESSSPQRLEAFVAENLAAGRPVLTPHDGFFDANAENKFQIRHVIHNTLVYGADAEARVYAMGDRYLRPSMGFDELLRAAEAIEAQFVAVTACRPFAGDWIALTRTALAHLEATATPVSAIDLTDDCVTAIERDRASDGVDRWRQSDAFFNGIGASRLLSADFLEAAREHVAGLVPPAEIDATAAVLRRLGREWQVLSAVTSKFLLTGRAEERERIRARLRALLADEAAQAVPVPRVAA